MAGWSKSRMEWGGGGGGDSERKSQFVGGYSPIGGFLMTQLLLRGDAPLSQPALPGERCQWFSTLSTRQNKITNKRIHLKSPKIETIVYWAIEREKKIRKGRVGGRQPPVASRGSLREIVISCFLPFYDGRLRQSSAFPFWRSFVAYFVKVNPKPLQGPLVLPSMAFKSWPICTGVGLSAVSLFQAHSHSLALISNCFFIFVCTFKGRDRGRVKGRKQRSVWKERADGFSLAPSVYPGPHVGKQHTMSAHRALCGPEGKASTQLQAGKETGGRLGDAWPLGEVRVERELRPSSPGMSRGSHLCLLLLGQEAVGVWMSNWLVYWCYQLSR